MNAVANAVITAIVIPIGPVNAPITVLNTVNALPLPAAAVPIPFSGVSIGASHLKNTPRPLDTLAIAPPRIPNPVSNGPIATANAPTFNINCC